MFEQSRMQNSRRCSSRRHLMAAAALATAACGCANLDTEDTYGTTNHRSPDPTDPAAVRSWAMQLQGLDGMGAVAALRGSTFDALVVDPVGTQRGESPHSSRDLVAGLRGRGPSGRRTGLLLAYLDVGQAEDYRRYWSDGWSPPRHDAPGSPSFILATDPDGWQGNYPVAYWAPRWHAVVGDLVDHVVDAGFDGVYLDWVLGAFEPAVVEAARRDGVDACDAMVALIRAVRERGRARAAGRGGRFVVVAQNAVALAEARPGLLGIVDVVAQEDLSFSGRASAEDWDDPRGGDVPAPADGPWSTAALGRRLGELRRRGVPVWTIDYALHPDNAARAAEVAAGFGFVPYVARTPLDRLAAPPATPRR